MRNGTLANAYGGDFERGVIWMLLHDTEFKDRVGTRLSSEILEDDGAVLIVEAFSDYTATYNAYPDAKALFAELKSRRLLMRKKSPGYARITKGIIYLGKLIVRTPIDMHYRKFITDKLQTFVKHRSLFNALLSSADLLDAGDSESIQAEIENAVRYADSMVAPSPGLEYGNIKAKMQRYSSLSKTVFHCPLGLPLLDNSMRGGLEPGSLGIFMGPTGRGKTHLLVHAGATAMYAGKNVVHITLELSDQGVELRYDANLTNVPINALMKDASKHKRALLVGLKKRLVGRLYIKQWGSNECTVRDIGSYLHMLKNVHGFTPQLVLVDYADLLRPSSSTKERRFELEYIVRELRQVAVDYNCAVWTASQTGKQSFLASVIRLNDVSECVAKVQIADVVVGICQTDNEKRHQMLRLALLKNRLGGNEGLVVDCGARTPTMSLFQLAVQHSGHIGKNAQKTVPTATKTTKPVKGKTKSGIALMGGEAQ